ncbi:MAG: ATP-binding protein [Planctomycetaceae bacterium]|nr:ATP-binding protein [Planctomycetaceae bacterium]
MTDANLPAEMAEMRLRLEEAEETIRAIRSGAVDAFVVEVPHGAQVYTLQTADRPYRLLVEEMQQSAITLSDDGTITYCNRRFADLVGRPLQRLVGVAFSDFIPLDAQCFYESLLQQGRADFSQGESHVQNADGALVPVFLTLNALPPDCGAAIGLLVTDLTTQRHHEKLNTLLEALTEADRRKNEFLAMLSHELRNPLAAISNATQLLRLQKNEDPLQEQAQAIIERQLGQLTHLVDELLEIARITTGRIHLNEQHVTLAGIVENAVETVSVLIGRHRHAFEVSLPPEPILLYADAARLEQVVVNLLTNAAKYTDAGGQIWLSVEQEVDEAVIRVRDTGVGIAPDMLPRIFELFTQAERSLDRAQGGLGIGLCLVQRLVQMHRGRVEAYSALGQGSEFVVRLPLVQTPAMPPRSAITEAIKPTGPFWRVLVVDDNRDAAQTAALLLMAWGHEVRTAYDGPAALEAARDFQPSVVLLDIGLPGLDGLAVARGLRQQSAFSHTVLIAMTGYGQETDRPRSLAAGFDHHLVKPVDFEKVRQILSNILQKAT